MADGKHSNTDLYALDIETNKIWDKDTEDWNVEIYSVQIMHVSSDRFREFDAFIKWFGETPQTGVIKSYTDINNYTGYKPDYVRFNNMLDALIYLTEKGEKSPIITYVHNLAYEGDYICRMLDGEINFLSTKHLKRENKDVPDVFALDTHKFVRIGVNNSIVFKCSYQLTNKSLASCGTDVGVMKGQDYEYDKYHSPNDKLSDEEENYCYRDVLIVCAKIRQLEKIYKMEYKDHTFFPLTSTGFVRNYVRKRCFLDKRYKYKHVLNARLLPEDYVMLECAFQGGDCSAVHTHTGEWARDVDSFDIGSSYPFQMLSKKFPTGKCYREIFKDWKVIQNKIRDGKLYIIDVSLKNLECKIPYMYLSASKCLEKVGVKENNGRVYKASMIRAVLTHIELEDIISTYSPTDIKINRAIYWNSEKLPLPIRQCIIKFFLDKNRLKPVKNLSEENYINYMAAKEMLNAIYGMMVQNPLRPEIAFTPETMKWKINRISRLDTTSLAQKLESHYTDFNTFLCYQWGVFVTAYARKQLHSAIMGCYKYLLYCDTDSLKVTNVDKVLPFIENYNNNVIKPQLEEIAKEMEISYEEIAGLGVFEWETKGEGERYRHFCTLGAKKYAVEHYNGKMEITVSGLSKKAITFIKDFPTLQKVFLPGTEFAEDTSGRTVSYYVYNSNPKYGDGGVLLLPTSYTLGLSKEYINFLEEMDNKKIPVTNYVVSKTGITQKTQSAKEVALKRLETIYQTL